MWIGQTVFSENVIHFEGAKHFSKKRSSPKYSEHNVSLCILEMPIFLLLLAFPSPFTWWTRKIKCSRTVYNFNNKRLGYKSWMKNIANLFEGGCKIFGMNLIKWRFILLKLEDCVCVCYSAKFIILNAKA